MFKPGVKEAVMKLFGMEGVYSNDPYDRGGETFFGIARKKHPDLPLWSIIDKWDKKSAYPAEAMDMVYLFYSGWWESIQADDIFEFHPVLAREYFYASVNCGKTAAGKMLQQSLNFMNRNQRDYKDLTVDGKVGNSTITAFFTLMGLKVRRKEDTARILRKQFNVRLGDYYNDLYTNNPEDERYIGWMDRVWMEG